jgi:hypothetical protein
MPLPATGDAAADELAEFATTEFSSAAPNPPLVGGMTALIVKSATSRTLLSKTAISPGDSLPRQKSIAGVQSLTANASI